MKFYAATIVSVDRPIKDIITITFELPESEKDGLNYYPGQHIVVRHMHDGQEIRRPYTLSSSPFAGERPSITIERVKGGKFSNYAVDNLQPDMQIDISDAHGFFYVDVNSEINKNYFCIAQGIGISPIFSIVKSILSAESVSRIYLVYESKNRDSILFEKEIEILSREYKNRLKVIHTLSHPSILPRLKPWQGMKGKITTKQLQTFFTEYPPTADDEFFICGSPALIQETVSHLSGKVDMAHVQTQQFTGEIQKSDANLNDTPVELTISNDKKTLATKSSSTILATLKLAQYPAAYGCESGHCGTCAAKLVDGKVEMAYQTALNDGDLANDWILTCQSRPVTEKVTIKF